MATGRLNIMCKWWIVSFLVYLRKRVAFNNSQLEHKNQYLDVSVESANWLITIIKSLLQFQDVIWDVEDKYTPYELLKLKKNHQLEEFFPLNPISKFCFFFIKKLFFYIQWENAYSLPSLQLSTMGNYSKIHYRWSLLVKQWLHYYCHFPLDYQLK